MDSSAMKPELPVGGSNVYNLQLFYGMVCPIENRKAAVDQHFDVTTTPNPFREVSAPIWIFSKSAEQCQKSVSVTAATLAQKVKSLSPQIELIAHRSLAVVPRHSASSMTEGPYHRLDGSAHFGTSHLCEDQ
jgi:hypothetical protein